MMKNVTSFLLLLALFGNVAYGNDDLSTRIFECGLSGCRLDCVDDDGHHQRVGKAKSIEMLVLGNGATFFTLNQSLGKMSTVIVGSEGFLCKITGQETSLRVDRQYK